MADIVSADILSPQRFAQELWKTAPPDLWVEFMFLRYRPTQDNPDAKRVTSMYYQVKMVLEDYASIATNLDHRNRAMVENIHHGVNPRIRKPARGRSKNSDVFDYVALWVDADFKNFPSEEAARKAFKDALEAVGIHPSCILESGHGLHAYWFLDHPYPVAEARPICAGLQDSFKISDAVSDPARVLRLPGTLNLKDPKNPAWCRVIEATWARYPLSMFEDFALEPTLSNEELEEKRVKATAGKPSRNAEIERIKAGVGSGERNDAAARYAGHLFGRDLEKLQVLEVMMAWNQKNAPPLPDPELVAVVDSIEQTHERNRRKTPTLDVSDGDTHTKKQRDHGPYFEGKEFLPERLARVILKKHKLIATPIGLTGRGVYIYHYRGGAFRKGGEQLVVEETQKALGDRLNDNRAASVQANIRIDVSTEYDALNPKARDLINVKNGMLNWRTGELLPHDPAYLSTFQIQADYDPAARSEVLGQFFTSILSADEIPVAEEFIGHLMIPDTSFGKCLVAVGEGGNGKSTFLRLLQHFLGPDNISRYSLHQITEERFSTSGLFGKLANFYDELESRAIENTATFKVIVTGDSIRAEEKGMPHFQFQPFCRLVFATNEMPHATDRSQGYFDRLLFLKFPNRIRETSTVVRDYDRHLVESPGLLSAVLNRAVAGLRRLTDQNRFSASLSSGDAIEDYRRECNSAYDFVKENCTFDDPTAWLAGRDFYDRYRVWCMDSGRKPMAVRGFQKTLVGLNVRSVRHKDLRGWGGVGWTNGTPPMTSADEIAGFGGESGGKRTDLDF